MSTRITIEAERSGSQERAYGSDVWTGTVTLEMNIGGRGWEPWANAGPKAAERWVRAESHFLPADEGDWYTPRLQDLEQIAPGVWRYRVERPYDD